MGAKIIQGKLAFWYYQWYNTLMGKERDTTILPVRIKKDLLAEVEQRVVKKKVSRNSWVIKAIKEGLRKHSKKKVINANNRD